MTVYPVNNIIKGNIGEFSVQFAGEDLGLDVDIHYSNCGGLDFIAYYKGFKIIGEVLNWYGGYIHPKRFIQIIKKLGALADYKILFCCGVYPTLEQLRILNAMNVKVIHLKKQILEITNEVINTLKNGILAVITTLVRRIRIPIVREFRIVKDMVSKVFLRIYNRLIIFRDKFRLKTITDILEFLGLNRLLSGYKASFNRHGYRYRLSLYHLFIQHYSPHDSPSYSSSSRLLSLYSYSAPHVSHVTIIPSSSPIIGISAPQSKHRNLCSQSQSYCRSLIKHLYLLSG